jgi:broad specificity phosphatase PhoE
VRLLAIFALLLPLMAACASTPPAPPVPNIYVIRHLHTMEGVQNAQLTEQGRKAAVALADRMAADPPAVIFVSATDRARQTAAPTAERFGVTPQTYDPRDTPGVVARVLAAQGTVLVVGHSNTVPDIVAGLGGQRPAPLVHADFGDLWHIQGPDRLTTRSRLP